MASIGALRKRGACGLVLAAVERFAYNCTRVTSPNRNTAERGVDPPAARLHVAGRDHSSQLNACNHTIALAKCVRSYTQSTLIDPIGREHVRELHQIRRIAPYAHNTSSNSSSAITLGVARPSRSPAAAKASLRTSRISSERLCKRRHHTAQPRAANAHAASTTWRRTRRTLSGVDTHAGDGVKTSASRDRNAVRAAASGGERRRVEASGGERG